MFRSIDRKTINKIEERAKKYFIDSSGCHDWQHVERVRKNALKIAKVEKADLVIVELSALFHDIAKNLEIKKQGKFCHAEKGAEMAAEILKEYNIDEEVIKNICHSIKSHRFRNNHQPQTIEAKVLQDADRLDAIGAIGIARVFLFAGNIAQKNLYTGQEEKQAARANPEQFSYTKDDSAYLEYLVKLRHLKDLMQTNTGKIIAVDRTNYMDKFFKRFWQEVGGEK